MLLLNDLLASTASADAFDICAGIADTLKTRDCLCVFVSNNHDLAASSPDNILLVAGEDREKPYAVARSPRKTWLPGASVLAGYQLDHAAVCSLLQSGGAEKGA